LDDSSFVIGIYQHCHLEWMGRKSVTAKLSEDFVRQEGHGVSLNSYPSDQLNRDFLITSVKRVDSSPNSEGSLSSLALLSPK